MTTPSQTPSRLTAGLSTDQPWGPLANFGQPNPFMYQVLQDDFMGAVSGNENWAPVTSGTGATVTEAAGDGGQWLLTTSSAGAGTAGILGNKGNFFLPPASYSGSGLTAIQYPSKKVHFLARVNITAPASETVYAGLMPSTTITGLPTDGIFFQITSLTSVIVTAYSASTLQWTVTVPAAALANFAAATWLDIGFYMDRLQNVYVFCGFPLVGFVPASAWTGSGLSSSPPSLGAVASYQTAVQSPTASTYGAWTPTTANLTLGIIATGTAQTAYVDFLMASKER